MKPGDIRYFRMGDDYEKSPQTRNVQVMVSYSVEFKMWFFTFECLECGHMWAIPIEVMRQAAQDCDEIDKQEGRE